MTRAIVVGGGFGGLLAGVELRRRGIDVLVVEAGPEPGGVARTISEDGYLLEPAAGTMLLPHPHLSPIFASAGIGVGAATDPLSPGIVATGERARTRYVHDRGHLFAARPSPSLLLRGPVSIRGILRAACELGVSPRTDTTTDESLRGFFCRRFGNEAGNLASTLMAHGVFAGDPDLLSARSALPAAVALEDNFGGVLRGAVARARQRPKGAPRPAPHVPVGGMAALARSLADSLGQSWLPGSPVSAVEQSGSRWRVVSDQLSGEDATADAVILALAPAPAAALAPAGVARILRTGAPRQMPVALVGIGGRSADLPIPSGFGVLAGPHSDLGALGILLESNLAPDRASAHHRLARGIFGGAADPGAFDLDDDELIARMVAGAATVAGTPVFPSWTRVVRHEPGIPQYELGHSSWLAGLDAALALEPGLHVGGWAYRGIGLSALATDAARLAGRIADID